ncbi:MAG: hypothetical protein J2P29_12815 [Actinobacteria bacterium]|nr:hypothetical protein [Actinomycetota bacterium]
MEQKVIYRNQKNNSDHQRDQPTTPTCLPATLHPLMANLDVVVGSDALLGVPAEPQTGR